MSKRPRTRSNESSSVSSLTPSSSEDQLKVFHYKKTRVDENYPFHSPLNHGSSLVNGNTLSLETVEISSTLNNASHVQRTLSLLDKEQLILVITSLMRTPALTEHILHALPSPTLASVSSILSSLNSKLITSLPYSKPTGPHQQPVSDYGYNRVSSLLFEMKDSINYYLDYFTNQRNYSARMHEYPEAAIGFLHLALESICKLPNFSTTSHNEDAKYSLIRRVVAGWIHVLGHIKRSEEEAAQGSDGTSSSVGSIRVWAGLLHGDCSRVEGLFGFKELWTGFIEHFGWFLNENERSF